MAAESVSFRAPPEALRLQLSEVSVAEGAESDLEYAFQLQLEEALQDSLRSAPDVEPPSESAAHTPLAEQPSHAYAALQLQVGVTDGSVAVRS